MLTGWYFDFATADHCRRSFYQGVSHATDWIAGSVPWIPVLVTSVFFGLLHTQNPEVLQFCLYKAMALYIGMGLFLGLITAMDDGLEIPMGIHYVNNLFSLLFVGYKGSVFEGTPTIFLKEAEDLTFASVISNLVVMGIVLFILKFIFRWPKFRRLFRKIDTTIG